ncbi:MAG: MBL fold metallo-hydrolase [bacterium]
MLFERIESKGLAHYSYLLGSGGRAVVIDPRRDCDIYCALAKEHGMRITHILETHRNEDYVTGSLELAARTGAEILHSKLDEFEYGYGSPVTHGDRIETGGLLLEALHTPGHTIGHLSYVLHAPQGGPWMCFCGDVLFAGDVGRTDLYGKDRSGEMAELLHHSIVNRILPLGDEVLLFPAHGPGSVCGGDIADREMTTIGLERRLNPWLGHRTKESFVQDAAARDLPVPPYFKVMEELNRTGPPVTGRPPEPRPLNPEEFVDALSGRKVLDTRSEICFGTAHVPNSLSIWKDGLPAYAGWFLPYDHPLLLVSETDDVSEEVRLLYRMGFDRIDGFLAGGMHEWMVAGQPAHSIRTVTVQQLCSILDSEEKINLLDVRSPQEAAEPRIPLAENLPIMTLPDHLENFPRNRPAYIFCGSGHRSMIGASMLKQARIDDVTVVLGGVKGWNSVSCPL